jgi:hypothetical protein
MNDLPVHPLVRGLVELADGVAQRSAKAAGVAELGGQLDEQVLALEVASRLGDLVREHLGEGEVLEQSDDVGKRLVEREHIRVRGL